jgi:hypothetical protein
MIWDALLIGCGIFTVTLGTVQFFLPAMLHYDRAIIEPDALFVRYQTTRTDLLGMVWILNHAASYALVSIGLLDIIGRGWLRSDGGWLSLWIAGWWFLRTGAQTYMGRRPGDYVVMTVFALLGVIHVAVFVA